jgi:hypothetical protein
LSVLLLLAIILSVLLLLAIILSVLLLLAIILSVLLQFTDCDYLFGIFNPPKIIEHKKTGHNIGFGSFTLAYIDVYPKLVSWF